MTKVKKYHQVRVPMDLWEALCAKYVKRDYRHAPHQVMDGLYDMMGMKPASRQKQKQMKEQAQEQEYINGSNWQ